MARRGGTCGLDNQANAAIAGLKPLQLTVGRGRPLAA